MRYFSLLAVGILVLITAWETSGSCRRRLSAVEKGRKCKRPCASSSDCKATNKICKCDGACGMSCYNPIAECPEPEDIPNGSVMKTTLTMGGRASYSCTSGYVISGSRRRTCYADKKWHPAAPNCTRGCGLPGRLGSAYATSYKDSFTVGERVKYKCLTGYFSDDDMYRTCGNNGWSVARFHCRLQTCDSLAEVYKGTIQYTKGQNFGSTAKLTCDRGYEADSFSTSIRCYAGEENRQYGEWSGRLPSCLIKTCTPPIPPENGSIRDRLRAQREYGSRIIYQCDVGFKLEGSTTGTCDDDGSWGTMPNCTLDPDCNFENSHTPTCGYTNERSLWQRIRAIKGDGLYGYVSEATYKTSRLISAVIPQDWSDEDTICLTFSYRLVRAGSSLEITHTSGYRHPDISWNSHRKERTNVWLDSLLNIATNRQIQFQFEASNPTVQIDDITVAKEACVDECDDEPCQNLGTCVSRSSGYTCFCETEFKGNQCETDRRCSKPPEQAINANLNNAEKVDYMFLPGSSATYDCIKNYKLMGYEYSDSVTTSVTSRCVEGYRGSYWSPSLSIRCVEILCPRPQIRWNQYLETGGTKDTWKVGERAVVRCKEGYDFAYKNIVDTITCQKDQTWSSGFTQCQDVRCPTAKLDIQHGRRIRLSSDGLIFGTTATYQCHRNYKFSGEDGVRRIKDVSCERRWFGGRSYWEPDISSLRCVEITCSKPQTQRHQTVLLYTRGKTWTVGQQATVQCERGYEFDNAEISIQLECRDDETWSKSIPTCLVKTCAPPIPPENGSISYQSTTQWNYGSTITYQCEVGFKLEGSRTGTCDDNKSWGAMPNCTLDPDCNFENFHTPTCGYTNERYLWQRISAMKGDGLYGYVSQARQGNSRLISAVIPQDWSDEDTICLMFSYRLMRAGSSLEIIHTSEYNNPDISWHSYRKERTNVWLDSFLNIATNRPIQFQFEVSNPTVQIDDIKVLKKECVDECEKKPCRNLGTCVSRSSGYTCFCTTEFKGNRCGTDRRCHRPSTQVENAALNVEKLQNMFLPGSSATYHCVENYKLPSNRYPVMTSVTSRCVEEGGGSYWRPSLSRIRCVEMLCSPPQVGTNQYLDASGMKRAWRVGEHAVVRCREGYDFGDEYIVDNITCRKDETWSNTFTHCREITCPKPQIGPHQVISDYYQGKRRSVGDQATYQCTEGYEFDENRISVQVRCTKYGSWEGVVPPCKEVGGSASGEREIDQYPPTRDSTVTTQTLQLTPSPVTPTTIRSTTNESTTTSVDVKKCDALPRSIEHGKRTTITNTSLHIGTSATYKCDRGWKMSGKRNSISLTIVCKWNKTKSKSNWRPKLSNLVCIRESVETLEFTSSSTKVTRTSTTEPTPASVTDSPGELPSARIKPVNAKTTTTKPSATVARTTITSTRNNIQTTSSTTSYTLSTREDTLPPVDPNCDFEDMNTPMCSYTDDSYSWRKVEEGGNHGHVAEADIHGSMLISPIIPQTWSDQDTICLKFRYKLLHSESSLKVTYMGEHYHPDINWESHRSETSNVWHNSFLNIRTDRAVQYQFKADIPTVQIDDIEVLKETCEDYCKNEPCQNGGTCVRRSSNHTCFCDYGFKGRYCDTVDHCSRITCWNGGTCISGPDRFTCNCANGFDGPRCETEILCPSPWVYADQYLEGGHEGPWRLGEQAVARCNEGYKFARRDAVDTITCTEDFTWSGIFTQCREKLCSSPPLNGNQNLEGRQYGTWRIGEQAVVRCNKGYKFVRDDYVDTITCVDDQTWRGAFTGCQVHSEVKLDLMILMPGNRDHGAADVDAYKNWMKALRRTLSEKYDFRIYLYQYGRTYEWGWRNYFQWKWPYDGLLSEHELERTSLRIDDEDVYPYLSRESMSSAIGKMKIRQRKDSTKVVIILVETIVRSWMNEIANKVVCAKYNGIDTYYVGVTSNRITDMNIFDDWLQTVAHDVSGEQNWHKVSLTQMGDDDHDFSNILRFIDVVTLRRSERSVCPSPPSIPWDYRHGACQWKGVLKQTYYSGDVVLLECPGFFSWSTPAYKQCKSDGTWEVGSRNPCRS